jgi:CBS domain-containing protein
VRNPDVNPAAITVTLDPAHGLDRDAADLVLERVYPTRWVSPRLWRAGESLELPLAGYEAAVYELRPLAGVAEPVLAGVVFEEDLMDLVVIKEIATHNVITAHEDEDLDQAMRKIGYRNIEQLPVVDRESHRKLIGIISRRDIVSAYNRALMGRTLRSQARG